LFEQAAKVPVLSVGLVRGEAAADDVPGRLSLGRKTSLAGDLRRPAAVTVGRPGFRQVEVPVYCRLIPAEVVPFLMNPVPSMINTPPGPRDSPT